MKGVPVGVHEEHACPTHRTHRIARTAFISPVAVLDGRSGQANATCEKKESGFHLEYDVSVCSRRRHRDTPCRPTQHRLHPTSHFFVLPSLSSNPVSVAESPHERVPICNARHSPTLVTLHHSGWLHCPTRTAKKTPENSKK
jgi:hypothetical protein